MRHESDSRRSFSLERTREAFQASADRTTVAWLSTAALLACFGVSLVAADGISGTWVAGIGPAAQTFVFRVQEDTFIGVVCGPCDDPSTVFRIADGRIVDAQHATFYILRDDARPVAATLSGNQLTLQVRQKGKADPVGMVLKRVVENEAPGTNAIASGVPTAPSNVFPIEKAFPVQKRSAIEGRWIAAGRVAQQNVTLKIRDNKVWGVICGPCNPDGVFLIEDGTLDGDAISFYIHHIDTPAAGVRQNGPGRNFMKGTITGNVMKFKWVREGRENEPGGEMTLIGPIR